LPNIAPAPYVRHRPELTLLYQVVEHHLPEFNEHLRERGRFLPRFVFQEFHDYLKCGRLQHGFVRVKCNSCRNELLVAFSCKHRGFCPSCGARSGAITFIQRFGSALNLNVHLHMLIPDGIYTLSHGKPRFHAVTAPSQSELTTLLNHIIRRITRQLTRDGLLAQEADQPYLDLQTDDTLDQFGAASLQ
jgi:ribosomal protein S27E